MAASRCTNIFVDFWLKVCAFMNGTYFGKESPFLLLIQEKKYGRMCKKNFRADRIILRLTPQYKHFLQNWTNHPSLAISIKHCCGATNCLENGVVLNDKT